MTLDEARQKMAESLSSLVELKIKVPLSDKTKNIHTNTWIYYEPVEFWDKIEGIYGEMKSLCKQFRYTFYRKNYWYVKGVEIHYKEGTMDLTLSPLPTPYPQEKVGKDTTSTSKTDTTTKTSNKNKSSNAPSWLSKSDKAWAENFVKKHTKGATSDLEKAKKIYNAFKDGYRYVGYEDLKYTTPKGNRQKAFNRGGGNCADGANILETLMLTGGIKARIKHAPNHYIVKLSINGKTYWVDNHGTKSWNKVWRGKTSESESNITNGEYING